MKEDMKKIAAMTAVLYFLEAEEKAARYELPDANTASPPHDGFWSFSGRQSQMMLRSMAQMRLFPGWKG